MEIRLDLLLLCRRHHHRLLFVVQVSVQFTVVPLTAVQGVDYTVSGSTVSLSDGQRLASVPITLIRSTQPRLARSFSVRLVNSTTGGAAVGHPAQCVVTIHATADAHGIFGNFTALRLFLCFSFFF